MTVIALVAPHLLQTSRFELGHVVKSFLMIAAPHPFSGRWEPMRTPGVGLPKVIGDASYSLYLSHFMLMSALGQVWRKAHLASLPGRDIIFIVSSLALCILIAIGFYRLVEIPVTRWLKARLTPDRPRSGAVISAGAVPDIR